MPKNKSGWLVCLDYPGKGDTLRTFEVLYSGPDRARAHAVAEKNLNGSDPKPVVVMRVTRSVTLSDDSLVASLPRAAF
jgi:hypothetical protein